MAPPRQPTSRSPPPISSERLSYGVRWQSEASTPLSGPGVAVRRRCTARPEFKRTFQRCFLSVTNNAQEFFCTPVSRHQFQSGVALRFPPHSIGCATTFCGVRWQSEAPTPLSSPGVTEHRRCTARPEFKRPSQRRS